MGGGWGSGLGTTGNGRAQGLWNLLFGWWEQIRVGFKIQSLDNKIYLKKLLTMQAFCVITILSKGIRAFDVEIKFFMKG